MMRRLQPFDAGTQHVSVERPSHRFDALRFDQLVELTSRRFYLLILRCHAMMIPTTGSARVSVQTCRGEHLSRYALTFNGENAQTLERDRLVFEAKVVQRQLGRDEPKANTFGRRDCRDSRKVVLVDVAMRVPTKLRIALVIEFREVVFGPQAVRFSDVGFERVTGPARRRNRTAAFPLLPVALVGTDPDGDDDPNKLSEGDATSSPAVAVPRPVPVTSTERESLRRGRDSNPRLAFDQRPLSKRVPSATRSPLLEWQCLRK